MIHEHGTARRMRGQSSRLDFLLSNMGLYFVDAPVRRSDVQARPARKLDQQALPQQGYTVRAPASLDNSSELG